MNYKLNNMDYQSSSLYDHDTTLGAKSQLKCTKCGNEKEFTIYTDGPIFCDRCDYPVNVEENMKGESHED